MHGEIVQIFQMNAVFQSQMDVRKAVYRAVVPLPKPVIQKFTVGVIPRDFDDVSVLKAYAYGPLSQATMSARSGKATAVRAFEHERAVNGLIRSRDCNL